MKKLDPIVYLLVILITKPEPPFSTTPPGEHFSLTPNNSHMSPATSHSYDINARDRETNVINIQFMVLTLLWIRLFRGYPLCVGKNW